MIIDDVVVDPTGKTVKVACRGSWNQIQGAYTQYTRVQVRAIIGELEAALETMDRIADALGYK